MPNNSLASGQGVARLKPGECVLVPKTQSSIKSKREREPMGKAKVNYSVRLEDAN